MAGKGEIAFSATDPLGNEVIAYRSTLDAHRLKHQEPFSDEDIAGCIASPTIIAKSGHRVTSHKDRLVYYKDDAFIGKEGPPIMKAVVDHSPEPGVLTSAFRTSKRTADGAIVWIDPEMKKGLTK